MKLLKLFWFLFPALALFAVPPTPEPTSTPDPDPEPDPVEPPANGGEPTEVKMSQKELDKLIGARAKQAAQSATNKLFEKLGVSNADEIEAALKKAKDFEEAQLSEAEKLQREMEAAKKSAAEATAAATQAMAEANEMLLKAAVMTAATGAGFNDPADAWLYIDREAIKPAEGGGYEGLEDAVKAVSEAKPYLVKVASEPPAKGTPLRRPPVKGSPPAGVTPPIDETRTTVRL